MRRGGAGGAGGAWRWALTTVPSSPGPLPLCSAARQAPGARGPAIVPPRGRAPLRRLRHPPEPAHARGPAAAAGPCRPGGPRRPARRPRPHDRPEGWTGGGGPGREAAGPRGARQEEGAGLARGAQRPGLRGARRPGRGAEHGHHPGSAVPGGRVERLQGQQPPAPVLPGECPGGWLRPWHRQAGGSSRVPSGGPCPHLTGRAGLWAWRRPQASPEATGLPARSRWAAASRAPGALRPHSASVGVGWWHCGLVGGPRGLLGRGQLFILRGWGRGEHFRTRRVPSGPPSLSSPARPGCPQGRGWGDPDLPHGQGT